jgi:hypothetical protein
VFAEVVGAKSFSAAADKLGISKSLASREVSALERSLAVKLLNRSTRKLSLTEAGSIFYEHCVNILHEAELAEQRVTQAQSEPAGIGSARTCGRGPSCRCYGSSSRCPRAPFIWSICPIARSRLGCGCLLTSSGALRTRAAVGGGLVGDGRHKRSGAVPGCCPSTSTGMAVQQLVSSFELRPDSHRVTPSPLPAARASR